MTFDDYQELAMRTAAGSLAEDDQGVVISALGLAGEAGEFADHVKKWVGQGHDLDTDKLDGEAGDVLWYLARYARWRGIRLSDIAEKNIAKLRARYPDGFESERSINR